MKKVFFILSVLAFLIVLITNCGPSRSRSDFSKILATGKDTNGDGIPDEWQLDDGSKVGPFQCAVTNTDSDGDCMPNDVDPDPDNNCWKSADTDKDNWPDECDPTKMSAVSTNPDDSIYPYLGDWLSGGGETLSGLADLLGNVFGSFLGYSNKDELKQALEKLQVCIKPNGANEYDPSIYGSYAFVGTFTGTATTGSTSNPITLTFNNQGGYSGTVENVDKNLFSEDGTNVIPAQGAYYWDGTKLVLVGLIANNNGLYTLSSCAAGFAVMDIKLWCIQNGVSYTASGLNYYQDQNNTTLNNVLPPYSIYSLNLTGMSKDGAVTVTFTKRTNPEIPSNICTAENNYSGNNYIVKKNKENSL